jgi:Flp pilus assembly protein TadD
LILDYFGSVYYLSGDKQKARVCYELASEILPNDETISSNLKRVQS